MVTIRIVPCLDVRDGRVVKGVRFEGLRELGDPAEFAARYAAEGADEIVFLDIAATLLNARRGAAATIARVRAALSIPLTVGGGIATPDDAARLFDAGADRVALNSAALLRPDLVSTIADRYGGQAAIVAIDARRRGQGYEVLVRAGTAPTGLDAASWAREAERRGAGEILLTSIDRDGTGEGYDLALLEAVRAATTVPLVASGGVAGDGRAVAQMLAAIDAGADALLLAGALHRGELSISNLKRSLAAAGRTIRPC
jgi:imidazoleglycerol phosphate synthase cyclase subunit